MKRHYAEQLRTLFPNAAAVLAAYAINHFGPVAWAQARQDGHLDRKTRKDDRNGIPIL